MAFVPVSTEPSVSVEEHLERILEAIEPLPPYDQPLLEALGLPVCEQITAPMDLPGFDNSGMDGYAVDYADVATATEAAPVHLPVVGEVAAGQSNLFAMSPGTAVKIMTGAPVPCCWRTARFSVLVTSGCWRVSAGRRSGRVRAPAW